MNFNLRLNLIFIGFLALAYNAQAQAHILCVWMNAREDKKIEIFIENSLYQGKVVWMEEPRDSKGELLLDRKNPDETLRGNTVLGILVLMDLKFKNNAFYGDMYIPSRGWFFDGVVEILNQNQIKVTADLGFVSGSRVWNRVK